MSRVALLDVNVLVALFFPEHVHHDLAHDWFSDERKYGWATCPMTENGFVRVAAQLPGEDGPPRPQELIDRLRRFCSTKHYQSWRDVVSLRDPALFVPEWVSSHRVVTDVYLLGLAKAKGGRLVTFDRTIPLKAVKGATPQHLTVVTPSE